MSYFCPVRDCKTAGLDESAAKLQGMVCKVHPYAALVQTALPGQLQPNLRPGATPNEVSKIRGTVAQTQQPQPVRSYTAVVGPKPVPDSKAERVDAPVRATTPGEGAKPPDTTPPVKPTANWLAIAQKAPSESAPVQNKAPQATTSGALSGGVLYGSHYGWQCTHCKKGQTKARHLPRLPESHATRDLAARFEHGCAEREKGEADAYKGPPSKRGGFMVGVLERSGRLYVAISGSGSEAMPKGARKVAAKLGLQIVERLPAAKTASGRAIDTSGLEKTGNAEFFECAAPKLIGAVLETGAKPTDWYMTEMWCGPSSTHTTGQVYESCGNCRLLLPMMLCLE
jgi:hypothetical protein